MRVPLLHAPSHPTTPPSIVKKRQEWEPTTTEDILSHYNIRKGTVKLKSQFYLFLDNWLNFIASVRTFNPFNHFLSFVSIPPSQCKRLVSAGFTISAKNMCLALTAGLKGLKGKD